MPYLTLLIIMFRSYRGSVGHQLEVMELEV